MSAPDYRPSLPAIKPLSHAQPQTFRNEVAVIPAKAGTHGGEGQGRDSSLPHPANAMADSQPATKPHSHAQPQTYRNEVALSLNTSAARAGYGSSSGSTGTSINVGTPDASASDIASFNSPSSDA